MWNWIFQSPPTSRNEEGEKDIEVGLMDIM